MFHDVQFVRTRVIEHSQTRSVQKRHTISTELLAQAPSAPSPGPVQSRTYLRYSMICHVIPCDCMLFHYIPCMTLYCMIFHAIPCYSIISHDMLLHAIPLYFMLFHCIPWHYMAWHSMIFHAIPLYTMALYCMLFHDIPRYYISISYEIP